MGASPMMRNAWPSMRTREVSGCGFPVQCRVGPPVNSSFADQMLKYGSHVTSGTAGGRCPAGISVAAKAPEAAGVIHTDFEKGFIRAEVIKYADFVSYGSEAKVKEAGKMSVEGKEYVVLDGDMMHFRFNV